MLKVSSSHPSVLVLNPPGNWGRACRVRERSERQSCGEAAYWDWKIGIGQHAPKGIYHEGSALLLYIFAASYFTFLPPSTLHFSPLLLYIFADLYPPLAPLKGGAGDQGHQRPQGHQRRAKGPQRHNIHPLSLSSLMSL